MSINSNNEPPKEPSSWWDYVPDFGNLWNKTADFFSQETQSYQQLYNFINKEIEKDPELLSKLVEKKVQQQKEGFYDAVVIQGARLLVRVSKIGFDPATKLKEIENQMAGITNDSTLYPTAEFLSKNFTQLILPDLKKEIEKGLKKELPKQSSEIISYLNKNEKVLNDAIHVNMMIIINNLAKKYSIAELEGVVVESFPHVTASSDSQKTGASGEALQNIITGLSGTIKKEIEAMSWTEEPQSYSLSGPDNNFELKIDQNLDRIADKILADAFPKGSKDLYLPISTDWITSKIPIWGGEIASKLIPPIKTVIKNELKKLYVDMYHWKSSVEKNAKDKLKETTGLDNIDPLVAVPAKIVKDAIQKKLDPKDPFLLTKIKEALPKDLPRRDEIAIVLRNVIASIYYGPFSEDLKDLLDTNLLVILAEIADRASAEQKEIEPDQFFTKIITFLLNKEHSVEDLKGMSNKLLLLSALKEKLPSLAMKALPEQVLKKEDVTKIHLHKGVSTFVEKQAKASKEEEEKLKEISESGQPLQVSPFVNVPYLAIQNKSLDIPKKLETVVDNAITTKGITSDTKTSKFIAGNVVELITQLFNPDNPAFVPFQKVIGSIGNGLFAKLLYNLTPAKASGKKEFEGLLPLFLSQWTTYINSKEKGFTEDEQKSIREAFAKRKQMELEKDPLLKEVYRQEILKLGAPLLNDFKLFVNKLFGDVDVDNLLKLGGIGDLLKLFGIEGLSSIKNETIPLLLFEQFGEMALPLLEKKSNEEYLKGLPTGQDLVKQCTEWSHSFVEELKKKVDPNEIIDELSLLLIGYGTSPLEISGRKTFRSQIQALLKDQDKELVWKLVDVYSEAAFMQGMANYVKSSRHSVKGKTLFFTEELLNSFQKAFEDQKVETTLIKQFKELPELKDKLKKAKIRYASLEKEITPILSPIHVDMTSKDSRIHIKLSDTAPRLSVLRSEAKQCADEIKDLESKIKQIRKPFVSRLKGVSDRFLSMAGWGSMPVPESFKGLLKETIIPDLLFDQCEDVFRVQMEHDETIKKVQSYKNGEQLLAWGDSITDFLMKTIKESFIHGPDLAEKINDLCSKDSKLNHQELKRLGKSLENLAKKGKVYKKTLFSLINKIKKQDPVLEKKLDGIKDEMNASKKTSDWLGKEISNLLPTNQGLSLEQQEILAAQIQKMISTGKPPAAWNFVRDHLHLIVLRFVAASAENSGVDPTKEDPLAATLIKFWQIADKHLKEGTGKKEFRDVAVEILSEGGIRSESELSGVTKPVQSPLYKLLTEELSTRLHSLYHNTGFNTELLNEALGIKRAKEVKEFEEVENDWIVVNRPNYTKAFYKHIGIFVANMTWASLKKGDTAVDGIKKLFPEKAQGLAQSIIDAWKEIIKNPGKADGFMAKQFGLIPGDIMHNEEQFKAHFAKFVESFVEDPINNLLSEIKKESLNINTNVMIGLMEELTKIVTEIDNRETDVNPKIASKDVYSDLSKYIKKYFFPQKQESLSIIDEPYRGMAWDQIKTNLLPLFVFKPLTNLMLNRDTLSMIWKSAFETMNKKLKDPLYSTQDDSKLTSEEKVNKALQNKLNEKCFDAFFALTQLIAPDMISWVLDKEFTKATVGGIIGSSIGKILSDPMVSDQFWTHLFESQFETLVESETLLNAVKPKIEGKIFAERINLVCGNILNENEIARLGKDIEDLTILGKIGIKDLLGSLKGIKPKEYEAFLTDKLIPITQEINRVLVEKEQKIKQKNEKELKQTVGKTMNMIFPYLPAKWIWETIQRALNWVFSITDTTKNLKKELDKIGNYLIFKVIIPVALWPYRQGKNIFQWVMKELSGYDIPGLGGIKRGIFQWVAESAQEEIKEKTEVYFADEEKRKEVAYRLWKVLLESKPTTEILGPRYYAKNAVK